MRFVLLLAAAAFVIAPVISQPIVTENFDYPVADLLTDHGWVAHSGGGSGPLAVTDNNLTFTGYPLATGNSTAIVDANSEDAHLPFTPVFDSPGTSVYASVLINASSVITDADGGYFFHYQPDPFDFDYTGRVYLRMPPPPVPGASSTFHEFNVGISKGSGDADIVWDTVIRDVDVTYLLVLKYTFLGGSGTDDTIDLYIFEDGDDISIEPASSTISADVATELEGDLANIGSVNLRQGAEAIDLTADGIRVATTWADIIPVELVSFDATVNGSDVSLNWVTASETNNAGFEIQLRGTGDFEAVGFADGAGTTTIEQSYGYTISDLAPGTYTVRLKQIDFDGAFEYSPQLEVAIGVPGTHVLTQAYPNPFNPQASFSLSVAADQHVDVALYNALGQQVAALYSGQMEAGQSRAFTINGANLPSGSYYYRAIGETFAESGRVTLLK